MALPAKLQADVNFRRGLAAAAGVSVLALAAIVIFLLSQALPIFAHVSLKDFLFSTEWYPTDDPPVFGIGALIAGSLACAALTTLIAACGTYALRKKPVLAAACPIVANGVIVGLMLALLYGLPVALTMGEVAIGELGAVFLGMVLLTVLKSRVDFNKISKM